MLFPIQAHVQPHSEIASGIASIPPAADVRTTGEFGSMKSLSTQPSTENSCCVAREIPWAVQNLL